MKKNSVFAAVILITAAMLLFSACNKKNDGKTGLHIFVTDENGQTVLGKDGEPLTEEWITKVEYATDNEGKTYTDANGDAVTVKQTRPSITKVIIESMVSRDEDGKPVTDKDGSYVFVPRTEAVTQTVTDKAGKPVTQLATEKSGETVTRDGGEPVTEPVTELHTELVTRVVKVELDKVVTYNALTTAKPSKTTAVYDNPKYTQTDPTKKNTDTPASKPKIVASLDWLKGFGGSKNDKFVQVRPTGSNTFAALAHTESVDGDYEVLGKSGFYSVLVKYDAKGNVLWKCALGSKGHTRMYDFAVLSDGSFIAVGESNATDLGVSPDGKYKSVIAKVSADGSVLWYKHIGGSSTEYFTCAAATPDGGFVAGGKFASKDGTFESLKLTSVDSVVSKYTANGDLQWAKKFGGSSSDNTEKIACDAQGNIYAACRTLSTDGIFKANHGGVDVALVKYSPAGEQLWYKLIGGSKNDEVNDIYAGSEGCVFAGRYGSHDGSFTVNRGAYDGYIGFCSAEGELKWLHTFGGLGTENVYAVAPTSFGYVAVGSTTSSNRDFKNMGNAGNYDGFIMSIDRDGKVLHAKSAAGSGNEACMAVCRLSGDSYIVVGETYSSSGDFALITPKAADKNSTAFVGRYDIF